MMKLLQLSTHWTAEEAHALLQQLDELRDAIWHQYHKEIIEYCKQCEHTGNNVSDWEDDLIPF